MTDRRAASGERPTVLQVLPALGPGGVERGTVDVADALVKAGWRALVVSSGGPKLRELERVGAEHFTMRADSKNPLVMHANIDRLAAIIQREGVDIVHARSRAPAWSARFAARRTGRPFVTTYHGTYNARGPLKRWYNSVMARGDRIIAISQFIADHVAERYKVDRQRIHVIHRGVDTATFDPKQVPAARVVRLSEAWRLPDGVPVVMLPGRLTRWKGHAVFLDALSLLDRDDYCAVILGDDQGRAAYREELQDKVSKLALHSVTRIVDHCDDMPAAFMLADVVVSASTDPEAFGRIVVEAQAMGRPVIASDHGGARETVIPEETGWLVRPGDVAALADAIVEAITLSKTRRSRLARAAMHNVRVGLTKETMCARTLEVYRQVLEDKSADASIKPAA